jgi:hypothetical protein
MADVIGGIVAELSATDNLSEPFERARQAVAAIEAELRRLEVEEQKGIRSTADYTAKVAQLTAEQQRLTTAMTAAAPRVNALDSAFGSAATKSGAFARGLLDLSRGIEDVATGGPIGGLNNIPGIFTNMASAAGVSATSVAGWTTGISLAATGAYLLYRNWDSVEQLWGGGGTLTEAERMDKLAKATSRTAEETEKLNKYKREQQQDEQQRARRPGAERETAGAVGSTLAEGPIERIEGVLARQLRANPRPVSDQDVEAELQRQLRAAPGGGRGGLAPGSADAARERLRAEREAEATDTAKAEARQMLREAEFGVGQVGEAARRRLGQVVTGAGDRLPQEFAANVGRVIAGETPLTAADRRRRDEEMAEQHREMHPEERLESDFDQNARFLGYDAAAGQAQKAGEDALRAKPLISPETQFRLDQAGEREAERLRGNQEAGKALDAAAPLQKRADDLQERLRHLLNPEKQGQSMAGEAYFGSFHSTTAESPEVKQQRETNKLLVEIKENTSKLQKAQRIAR